MNTYEKVIAYLEMYKELNYEVEFYQTKWEGLKAISYSQEAKGTAVDNMMSVYMQKVDEVKAKQKEIESFIESNFSGKSRLIIYNKFIEGMSYKAIGKKIGYSTSYVKSLMDKAIYRFLAK